jgi:hypothetical protein
MNKAYVSLISTNDFLPGVLALSQSLNEVGSTADLVVLVAAGVSPGVTKCLASLDIAYSVIEPIENPNTRVDALRFVHTYNKLRIFEREEYDKIVYVDADMLACGNLDELFDWPAGAAVNAGGMLPECSDWTDFNSGLMVVEPRRETFERMMRLRLSLPSKDGGDQGFLHSYFPEWPGQQELHLDHKYNLYVGQLERYRKLFDYQLPGPACQDAAKSICALHFWGFTKPWSYGRVDNEVAPYNTAFDLWWDCFEKAVARVPAHCRGEVFWMSLQSTLKNKSRLMDPD